MRLRTVALIVVALVLVLLGLHAVNLYVPTSTPGVVVSYLPSKPIPGDLLRELDDGQRAVLMRWLESHDVHEVMTAFFCDFDRRASSCEAELARGNPYVAAGDFNGDRHADFAVMARMLRHPFSVFLAVFNGPFAPGAAVEPVLLAEDKDFARLGDMLTVLDSGGGAQLFLAPMASDNGYTLVPAGTGYALAFQGNGG